MRMTWERADAPLMSGVVVRVLCGFVAWATILLWLVSPVLILFSSDPRLALKPDRLNRRRRVAKTYQAQYSLLTNRAHGAVISQLFGLAMHVGQVCRSKRLGIAEAMVAVRNKIEMIEVFMMMYVGWIWISWRCYGLNNSLEI